MLSYLLTSLDITLPIFVIILLGWCLRRGKMLDEHFVVRTNALIFNVALPAMLFSEVAGSDLRSSMDLRFVLLAMGASALCVALAWPVGSLLLKDPGEQGAFIHGSFRGNFAYVGLALLQNVAGSEAMAYAALLMATVIPLYGVAGVVVLSNKRPGAERPRMGAVLLDVVKTPIIIAILAAIPFSLLRVEFPFVISKPLSYLSAMVMPLALINVGAGVSFGSVLRKLRKILPACFLKLILQPLIMVPAGILLGLNGDKVLALLVLSATPAAVNSYIITKQMGGDGDLASGIVVLSTALSVLTLTLWLFALKCLGVW